MSEKHEVLVRQEVVEPDGESQISNIIRTMLRNPLGTIQIVAFIGGMCGFYYANERSIADVRAEGERHFKDLSLALTTANEKVIAKVDMLVSNDISQTQRIEQVFQRGDQRWATVQAKQTESDVKFARIESALSYIVRAVGKDGYLPLDK